MSRRQIMRGATAIAAVVLMLGFSAASQHGVLFAQMTMTLASAGGDGVSVILESYEHTIDVPRDEITARATGRREHSPFHVTKRVDRATPLLYRAMSASETIPSVTIRVPTTQARGGVPVTITMTNALIIGIRSASGPDEALAHEDIWFVYEKIKWSSEESGTEFEDSWRGR